MLDLGVADNRLLEMRSLAYLATANYEKALADAVEATAQDAKS